jgi:hypothetical protein
MRREHSVSLEGHSATSTDHRGEPRQRPGIRRLAVIGSDSHGFRVVNNPSGGIARTRPQLDGGEGRQGGFGAPAVSRPSRRVRAPALAH